MYNNENNSQMAGTTDVWIEGTATSPSRTLKRISADHGFITVSVLDVDLCGRKNLTAILSIIFDCSDSSCEVAALNDHRCRRYP